ncbi:hypothetical protein V8D89_001937 [Ganoderma adspersum]
MQFFTLFAAIVAASATFAVAAPTDDGYNQPNKTDCGKCEDGRRNGTDGGHHGGDDGQWSQKARVGHSLDLWPNTPLSSLSCSGTFNKMYPQFHTLGDLPTAPFYGEAPDTVDGSGKCGACWKLQYEDKEPVYMIAVDRAAIFQLGKNGFEKFAGCKGFDKGSVEVKATKVSPEQCDLPPAKQW